MPSTPWPCRGRQGDGCRWYRGRFGSEKDSFAWQTAPTGRGYRPRYGPAQNKIEPEGSTLPHTCAEAPFGPPGRQNYTASSAGYSRYKDLLFLSLHRID